jgi:two-component sensor histidine kinase
MMQASHGQNLTALVDTILARLRRTIPAGSARAYLFALACVGGATAFQFWIRWLDPQTPPFLAYYPTMALCALLGGVGPGIFVALSGSVTAWWAFMPPAYSFSLERTGDSLTLVVFAFGSAFIIFASDYFRRAAKRLEDEQQLRQLAVEELAHRLKNKIATIQAIISVQLREHPEIRKDILDRLQALSATDRLIEEANGQGAFVRNIAETELGPYVASRVSIQGPDLLLPPKYALTIALLLHELATNAAKYGSLSKPEGHVFLLSRVSGELLFLEWRETAGPTVCPPRKTGFGVRLLSRALQQFGGATEMFFEPSGLVCKMRLALPPPSKSGTAENDDEQPLTATT